MGWFGDALNFVWDKIAAAKAAGKPKLEDPLTGELQSEIAKAKADADRAARKKP